MLHMVKAFVEVRGEMRELVFLTNNFSWSERTIAELYRVRWGIVPLFKEIKQTCQIHDFIGYSGNALKRQVWAGLIGHLLLRYIRYLAKWKHRFSRLAGAVQGSLWLKKKLLSLLELYEAARAVISRMRRTKSLYFQPLVNFANAPNGTAGASPPP
jgi:IS4 transposase